VLVVGDLCLGRWKTMTVARHYEFMKVWDKMKGKGHASHEAR